MDELESHIQALSAAQSGEELFRIFTNIMNNYGYPMVAYGFATSHKEIGLDGHHGYTNSFPRDWVSHYVGNKLQNIDPVASHMLKTAVPTYWSSFDKKPISSESKKFMLDASEAGLKDGAVIPLHSVGGQIAGLSVTTDQLHPDRRLQTLAVIQFLGVFFHEKYKSFYHEPEPVELTDREREILTWAAEGKSDAEISMIVNISSPTVRYHWKNVFRKFNTYSRVSTITSAIRRQLITPYAILRNYQV